MSRTLTTRSKSTIKTRSRVFKTDGRVSQMSPRNPPHVEHFSCRCRALRSVPDLSPKSTRHASGRGCGCTTYAKHPQPFSGPQPPDAHASHHHEEEQIRDMRSKERGGSNASRHPAGLLPRRSARTYGPRFMTVVVSVVDWPGSQARSKPSEGDIAMVQVSGWETQTQSQVSDKQPFFRDSVARWATEWNTYWSTARRPSGSNRVSGALFINVRKQLAKGSVPRLELPINSRLKRHQRLGRISANELPARTDEPCNQRPLRRR